MAIGLAIGHTYIAIDSEECRMTITHWKILSAGEAIHCKHVVLINGNGNAQADCARLGSHWS